MSADGAPPAVPRRADPEAATGGTEAVTGGAATRTRAAIPDLARVRGFLRTATPAAWFAQAGTRIPLLLTDHANCEKKAAGNALNMLYRYVDRPELLFRLSRLAREELRHFEQVCRHMQRLGIRYAPLPASRYAAGLRSLMATREPQRLIDGLLIGAIVEARSCERFAGLIGVVPPDLARFYSGLLASEARHFEYYLDLAQRYSPEPLAPRIAELLAAEAELISATDTEFRFHSGPLAESTPD